MDPHWKPNTSNHPLFFGTALFVPNSLFTYIFCTVSFSEAFIPLTRFSLKSMSLGTMSSWLGFSGWHFCLFSPVVFKGTKWCGENHAPALLSRFPSLDHNKKRGPEETEIDFLWLISQCRKSLIHVMQFGYAEKIGLPKTLNNAAIWKNPLHSYDLLAIHASDQIASFLLQLLSWKTWSLLVVKQTENSVSGWWISAWKGVTSWMVNVVVRVQQEFIATSKRRRLVYNSVPMKASDIALYRQSPLSVVFTATMWSSGCRGRSLGIIAIAISSAGRPTWPLTSRLLMNSFCLAYLSSNEQLHFVISSTG